LQSEQWFYIGIIEMGTSQTGPAAIVAPRLFDGAALRGPAALLHENGRIVALTPPGHVPAGAVVETLPADTLLAPGFIDVQVNGGGGTLFNDRPTLDGARAIMQAHERFGTTSCLPTLITDSRDAMARAVAAAREGAAASGFLGVHLEGPFLNPARKGVHREDLIAAIETGNLDLLGGARLVTLAPEHAPRGFIRALAERGVTVAAGHTEASADQMRRAADEGLTGLTHLFNAMPPLQGRAPGPVGAAFADERLFAGIICDGLHVDSTSVRAAWRALGAERLMLVTDAMPSVGAAVDRFILSGREIRLVDGRLVTADGTLAGAHLDMAGAVRNAVRLCGIPLADALRMASATPARFLKLDDRLGQLAPGHAADMVALDGGLSVTGVWRRGARLG
jgi:N-acetylglucosamine-6-phosphate deacetylase